jgi:hypothetical protein
MLILFIFYDQIEMKEESPQTMTTKPWVAQQGLSVVLFVIQ